ncbi:MAG: T9SS C-terminal target domain-containing protein [Calditrichaeota bacterium]|nr:MAG: T9SS C-terminal target domain-containing protein [Calditrichota bacterium]
MNLQSKGYVMKKSVFLLVLFSLLIAAPLLADVYTRLHLISNENGVLVVDVQAISDNGSPLISLYRGAFKISETLEQRVLSVKFEHLLFHAPNYIQEFGYSSPYRKVTWIYTFDAQKAGPYASIGTDWTDVLRVTITYNQAEETATLSWAQSPSYMVKDDQGNDITGDFYPMPQELQDFPLPVQLSTFSAEFESEQSVKVTWRTETELNNLGFNIYRSLEENDGFSRLNEELIPGMGTTSTPNVYEYKDQKIDAGKDYWYTVESISLDGLSTFYGPTPASIASDVAQTRMIPQTLVLEQNYPNPFNPNTELRYQIMSAGEVNLSIYNLQGQMIQQLVSAQQREGTYVVTWNGLNARGQQVESGVYIYELRFADQVLFRKMTLLR